MKSFCKLRRVLVFFFALLVILCALQIYHAMLPPRKRSKDIRTSAPNNNVIPKVVSEILPSHETAASSHSPVLTTGQSKEITVATTKQLLPTSNLVSLWQKKEGPSWPRGSFCQSFIVDTYDRTSVVCPNRLTCYGSQHSKKMGKCTVHQMAIQPKTLYDVLKTLKVKKIVSSESVWLLDSGQSCSNPNFHDIGHYMEVDDIIMPIVKMATSVKSKGKCNHWVNGTTFFYVGMAKHIYFKFLGWYNLFRSLRQYNYLENYTIIRLPETSGNFAFEEYEHQLFRNVIPLETLKDEVICFNSVELVPWAYSCPLFRCKMDGVSLKRKCLECNGIDMKTDLIAFRDHVISSCSLHDETPKRNGIKTITIIERKQYERFNGDKAKKFHRIWTNSDEFISTLRTTFPQVNVTGVFAEKLDICDQVRIAHNTDLLIAVHGAGLVHLWWQQSHGQVLELVPRSQRGNAAFVTLSKLIGRKHKLCNQVKEKGNNVTINIKKVIEEVKTLIAQSSKR